MNATTMKVNGVATPTHKEFFNVLNPISKFDPIGNEGRKDYTENDVTVFVNSNEKISLDY
jgi:hypothetical protein